jgi:hypothetical protein
MAVCGTPEDHRRCPECKTMLRYNAATRSYLHVLAVPATCSLATTGVRS